MTKIIFDHPDDSANAANTLSQALESLGNLPILGLLIKTVPDGEDERITNWRFADTTTVKSLALVLPKNDITDEE